MTPQEVFLLEKLKPPPEGSRAESERLPLLKAVVWVRPTVENISLLKAELAILQGVDESGLAVSLGEKLSRRHHERELLKKALRGLKEAVWKNRITRWEMNVAEENITQLLGIAEDEINEPPLSLKAPTQKKRASLVIPQHEPQRPEAPTNP